jgi:N-acetylmuramoyl-L-alanine amidase
MRCKIFTIVFIIFISNSCSNNKYAATNHSYKNQAKQFAKQLRKQPNAVDNAVMAQQWAGSTNFGMRKPNFVIIHCTKRLRYHRKIFYPAPYAGKRTLCNL